MRSRWEAQTVATDSGANGAEPTDREAGQTLSEYALLIAFIFAVCILAVGALAVVVSGEWQNFVDLFPN
jgi:Flp pilus assembly pilin Flp